MLISLRQSLSEDHMPYFSTSLGQVACVTWSATERRERRSISQYPFVFELTGLKD